VRVVAVTQGTVANRETADLIEPAIAGLADLDALVVVITGNPDTQLENVPDNVRVSPYIPYDRLLPEADVLVTNGGYGGVLQALSHGVPMVVAGVTEDKPEIAARVQWSGAGIDLRTGRPAPTEVGAAVQAVLETPSFSQAAERLQTEIAAHKPFDEIAAQLEELLQGAQR
jgi:UDP:flavonoid glycosyltransferase YjiC (YdhE family)